MQTSHTCATFQSLYDQPMQQIDPYSNSTFLNLKNDSTGSRSQGTEVSFQSYPEKFFTLESTPATDHGTYSSPSAVTVSSNRSPFSPQGSQSYASNLYQPPDNTYGSPLSGSSGVEDENRLLHALWVLRNELLVLESDTDDSGTFNGVVTQSSPFTRYNKILEMAPQMDLKQLLCACAEIVSEAGTISFPDRQVAISAAEALIEILEKMVSVSGEPSQRLGAYMLEGLRARL